MKELFESELVFKSQKNKSYDKAQYKGLNVIKVEISKRVVDQI